jgi:hypothetical protein
VRVSHAAAWLQAAAVQSSALAVLSPPHRVAGNGRPKHPSPVHVGLSLSTTPAELVAPARTTRGPQGTGRCCAATRACRAETAGRAPAPSPKDACMLARP